MVTIGSYLIDDDQRAQELTDDRYYWTMLILSPTLFFPSPLSQKKPINLGKVGHRTAELSYIVHALREVEGRWREFNDYIGDLLVEDFMDPKAYTKLLFDDETFSRSRLYFWIIACLTEFDASIGDNIKQWKLFRLARVSPPLRHRSWLPTADVDRFQELNAEGEGIRQTLEDLQAQFRAKLASVQALRDGVSVLNIPLPIIPRYINLIYFYSFSTPVLLWKVDLPQG